MLSSCQIINLNKRSIINLINMQTTLAANSSCKEFAVRESHFVLRRSFFEKMSFSIIKIDPMKSIWFLYKRF